MAANQPMAARAQLASPSTHRVTRAQVPHASHCAAHTSISLVTDPWGQPLALSCAYANVFVVPAMWAPCSCGWVGLAAAAHWDPCVRCLLPYLRMVLTTDDANHAVANQIRARTSGPTRPSPFSTWAIKSSPRLSFVPPSSIASRRCGAMRRCTPRQEWRVAALGDFLSDGV
jgi:hypothetical protein